MRFGIVADSLSGKIEFVKSQGPAEFIGELLPLVIAQPADPVNGSVYLDVAAAGEGELGSGGFQANGEDGGIPGNSCQGMNAAVNLVVGENALHSLLLL